MIEHPKYGLGNRFEGYDMIHKLYEFLIVVVLLEKRPTVLQNQIQAASTAREL
jgi:hypothetical protein